MFMLLCLSVLFMEAQSQTGTFHNYVHQ